MHSPVNTAGQQTILQKFESAAHVHMLPQPFPYTAVPVQSSIIQKQANKVSGRGSFFHPRRVPASNANDAIVEDPSGRLCLCVCVRARKIYSVRRHFDDSRLSHGVPGAEGGAMSAVT